MIYSPRAEARGLRLRGIQYITYPGWTGQLKAYLSVGEIFYNKKIINSLDDWYAHVWD